MKIATLSFPQVSLLAGTRVLLGGGLGLLLAEALPENKRKKVGWTLAAIGGITTFPLLMMVRRSMSDKD